MEFSKKLKKILGYGKTAADYPRLSRLFNVLMWGYTIVQICRMWVKFKGVVATFKWFELGEFLINYQGGFVRRGLLGEILFQICQMTGVSDPRYVIFPFCGVMFCIVFYILIAGIIKYKMWWWILPTSVCLGTLHYNFIRKDFMSYVLLILIFWVLRNKKIRDLYKLSLVTVICIFSIVNYEASFFMFMPLVGILIFSKKTLNVRIHSKIIASSIVLFGMAVILFSTGNAESGQIIQSLWHNHYPNLIDNELSAATAMMSWGIMDSLKYNQSIPYILISQGDAYSFISLFTWLLYIILGLWIIINYPFICNKKPNNKFPIKRKIYSRIVMVQFISLLPLFLGLSCDYGRLLSYICITSLLTTFLVPMNILYDIFNIRLFKRIPSEIRILSAYFHRPAMWLYMIIFCISYIPFTSTWSLSEMFSQSIIGTALHEFLLMFRFLI